MQETNGNKTIVGYVQDSSISGYYEFNKYCVDDKGIVTKAPSTGICPGSGEQGVNKLFTDLNAIPRADVIAANQKDDANKIDSTIQIKSSLPTNSILYNNKDSCEFVRFEYSPPEVIYRDDLILCL